MSEYLVNPAARLIQHNPTGACYGYDNAGRVTLRTAGFARADEIWQITRGAADAARNALRLERGPTTEYIPLDIRTGQPGA
jgi:hypothetical protein